MQWDARSSDGADKQLLAIQKPNAVEAAGVFKIAKFAKSRQYFDLLAVLNLERRVLGVTVQR